MSEAELNSYRFISGEEPSDEMLAQIMREAAIDAKERNEKANKKFFDEIKSGGEILSKKIAEKFNSALNG